MEILTSSAAVCLFSQFKEVKLKYILRQNKTLSNDHVLIRLAKTLKKKGASNSWAPGVRRSVFSFCGEGLVNADGMSRISRER